MKILIIFVGLFLPFILHARVDNSAMVLSCHQQNNFKPLFSNMRACCTLPQDLFSRMTNFTMSVDVTMLDKHIFQNTDRSKEGNGLLYTCSNGYIDLAHLRDTADWTKEVYNVILNHLGQGNLTYSVKREGAFRSLELKDIINNDLTQSDLATIAANIAYENAVWHEIATGLEFVYFQHMSVFSPEDNFSNYLGTHLAKKTLLENLNFEEGMTEQIFNFISKDLNNISSNMVSKDLGELEGIIWEHTLLMTDLLTWNAEAYGEVYSFKSPKHIELGCSESSLKERGGIQVESILSNGRRASEYFDLKVLVTKSMRSILKKLGIKFIKSYLTEEDHSWLIPLALQYRMEKSMLRHNTHQ